MAATQPIASATVQLYTVGTSGNGSAATSLLSSILTTDATGAFTIPASYQCPSASSLVYLVARGGKVGTGSTNSAIGLMTPIGACNTISASTQAIVNEATTVAAAWALAPFMAAGGNIGASSTNTLGLNSAFATAASLVDPVAGTSPGTAFPANGQSPAAKINTLANVLNACVIAVASNGCTQLFTATTVGSFAPSDTLDAAYEAVRNPGKNVATLFGLSSASSAYKPVLSSAPADWTMNITFTGAAMNEPTGIGADSKGNIWVSNYFGVLSEFSPIGKPIFDSGITGYGLQSSYGLAIDAQDNIWVPNEDSPKAVNNKLGSVTVLNSSGQPVSGQTGFSQGGLNYPIAVAIDTNATAWVVDFGNSHVTLLSSSGNPLSGTSGYAGPLGGDSLAFPVAVVVDSSHNGWVANQGVDYITRITPDGKQFTNVHCCDSPDGLAVDQQGYIWASNYYGNSISQISSSTNTVVSPGYQGGGLSQPVGLAIDGAGNVWVANFRGLSATVSPALSEFSGASSNSPGQALSPSTGWGADAGMLQSFGIAVDASGSVWLTNLGNNSITKFVGIATPVKTPVVGTPQAP
jgi:streptogramin lyase